MRKTLVILFAVAILGGAGIYAKDRSGNDVHTATAMPSSSPGNTNSASSSASASYKDGTYQGDAAETPYGTVQIAVVISGGKITDVNFLKMPSGEDRSRQITQQSEPQLKLAAITAQSPSIDFVTGATSTSYGYQESLQKALDQAKLS